MKFSLGCSLVYHVPAPMPFVFNVEVASFAGQTIQHDELFLDPDLPVERWTMPETGNRYLRVMAQPGDLQLRSVRKSLPFNEGEIERCHHRNSQSVGRKPAFE